MLSGGGRLDQNDNEIFREREGHFTRKVFSLRKVGIKVDTTHIHRHTVIAESEGGRQCRQE